MKKLFLTVMCMSFMLLCASCNSCKNQDAVKEGETECCQDSTECCQDSTQCAKQDSTVCDSTAVQQEVAPAEKVAE